MKPAHRLSLFIAIASLISAAPCPIASAGQMEEKSRPHATQSETEIRGLLIGSWVGRKVVTYRKDGAWLLRKYEGATPTVGHWSLKGNELTFTNPEAGTFTQKIESVSKTKLIFATHDQDREWDRTK